MEKGDYMSNKYLTAKLPTTRQLASLRKQKKKIAAEVAALRERQALQENIMKQRKAISQMKREQSKFGKVMRRASAEWKASEKQRKRIGKGLAKAYRELDK